LGAAELVASSGELNSPAPRITETDAFYIFTRDCDRPGRYRSAYLGWQCGVGPREVEGWFPCLTRAPHVHC